MIHIRNISKKKKYYLAISGGEDSTVCAHLLWRLGYDIVLFTYHHGCQDDNDLMVEHVEKFAKEFKIPLLTAYNDTRISEGNLEAKLREKRIEAFKKLDSPILTAHHLGDCIENFIVNSFSGNAKYCPIPIKTKLDGTENYIIRPFMLTKKEDISKYAERNNLRQFIFEDKTNKNNSYRRNYIRNILVPLIPKSLGLEKTVKRLVESFYRASSHNSQ